MVNDAGQLYTMEGIAAGIIMLLTAYIVVSTTSIYTAGDTHIPDMQLERARERCARDDGYTKR